MGELAILLPPIEVWGSLPIYFMVTNEEKKQALYSLAFNKFKFIKLLSFALASFSLGLCALYYYLDYNYTQKIETGKEQIIKHLDFLASKSNFAPASDLYEHVVEFKGILDVDGVTFVNDELFVYEKQREIYAVKGQKRLVAPNVYEIRFIED